MTTYRVTWEMEFDSETPLEAAEEALEVHRDPTSTATCFTVVATNDPLKRVSHVDVLSATTCNTEEELIDHMQTFGRKKREKKPKKKTKRKT